MNELNFNLYAYSRPQNEREFLALLDEAIRMGEELHAMLDHASALLRHGSPAVAKAA